MRAATQRLIVRARTFRRPTRQEVRNGIEWTIYGIVFLLPGGCIALGAWFTYRRRRTPNNNDSSP